MTFGEMLKTLRTGRGMTQSGLADRAGVSDFTVYTAEGALKCPWKRTTALAVLDALNAAAPLTPAELAAWYRATGMEPLARQAERVASSNAAATKAAQADAATATTAYSTAADVDATTAHQWVQRLLEEAGATRTLAALEALAASWAIGLPPRVRPAHMTETGRVMAWQFVTFTRDDAGAVYRTRQIIPVPSPTPQTPQPNDARTAQPQPSSTPPARRTRRRRA